MRIAVVVAWDGRHPVWLSEALRSIDAQNPAAAERCLVVDSPAGLTALANLDIKPAHLGWRVRHGTWGNPTGARNEGLDATSALWLVFWDADNVMPRGFLRAVVASISGSRTNVGIIYPDIEYVDANLGSGYRWRVPDWDYWSLRSGNYIDTASAWRREAVELAGGWPAGLASFEDYALALEVTRRGWLAKRRDGPPIVMRQHETSRSNQRVKEGARRADLGQTRSLGILTLLSGRMSTYDRWEKFLRTAELPRHTSLYVVENSGNAKFTSQVQRTCAELAGDRRLENVTVSVRADRYNGPADEPYFVRERHLHIARLYADVMPKIRDDLILTLEDDVEPPPDAVRRLIEQMGCRAWGNFGAIAAAYDMGGDELCAGRLGGGWGRSIRWSEISDQPLDVGSVGGGCTLWANWALAGQPIPFLWHEGLGWDGSLCSALRRHGYRIQVHAGVRCAHHVHGIVRQP